MTDGDGIPSFWQTRLGHIPTGEPMAVFPVDNAWAFSRAFRPTPIIVFVGRWERTVPGPFPSFRSSGEFDSFELVFGGSVIRWFGSRGPAHGRAEVYVDGELRAVVDAHADVAEDEVLLYERADLDPGVPHKIRVVARRASQGEGTRQVVQRLEAVVPLSYPVEIADARSLEYSTIRAGEKPVPDPRSWIPVVPQAIVPRTGVLLSRGVLRDAFDRNLRYLRDCLASPTWANGIGWTEWLPASNEGRMLAGIANSLRWESHSDLRESMHSIVSHARKRKRVDGYYDFYPEDEFALEWGRFSERKNYDRVFWTRGMLAAAEVGAPGADELVRELYDWFNSIDSLPSMLFGSNATNGLPGGPLVYLSSVGRSEDLVTTVRFYDQDYWIEELGRSEPLAFAFYPGERPHCYLLLGLEAFGLEYLATGDPRYLDALLGGWKAYRENFLHVGGVTTLMERDQVCLPKSYEIGGYPLGELCGAVFWVWVNQLLQSLDPTQEAYAREIEETILGAVLAAQDREGRLRYWASLSGHKHPTNCQSTCCEVSGSQLIARLPELLFSLSGDDIFVHQYFAGVLETGGPAEATRRIALDSTFPYSGKIRLTIQGAISAFVLHIRVPAWSPHPVEFWLGEELIGVGIPGEYFRVERDWQDGDSLVFDLAPRLRIAPYEGIDQAPGCDRAAFFFGPLLLALTGFADESSALPISIDNAIESIEATKERDLISFPIPGMPGLRLVPYFEIEDHPLEVYPMLSRHDPA
ncbi:beta-L-arabinofuranosidase domain-containing protein [Microbacterium immunditiarum]|uniref:Non-reducing end beta-L-arabinofuranosidase-like GH127 middle domain-containing protein n=1 Tax=Microbacterium immunditiarum TaxID=337480 RepID=A0A7Y9GKD7_9MICO|nr:beta-L-arabinofuranosidase domain-containing protein [Microbacterium immunditiarum]NYE18078.1 hypothetical protein [Microbacterium immunditiarum]